MQKHLLIILSACLLSANSCENHSQKKVIDEVVNVDGDKAYLNLDRHRADIGRLSSKKAPSTTVSFEVINIGKAPLIILNAEVSCGCMSVDYPKKPILPDKKATITVTVDTKAQEGIFNKTITIKSNAENNVEVLRIVGEIEK